MDLGALGKLDFFFLHYLSVVIVLLLFIELIDLKEIYHSLEYRLTKEEWSKEKREIRNRDWTNKQEHALRKEWNMF